MIIAVPTEVAPKEKRVALTPEVTGRITKMGISVRVEKGAGAASNFPDRDYEEAGAELVKDRTALFAQADLLIAINTPPESDLEQMKPQSMLICLLWALQHPETVEYLKRKNITALGMDAVPRISRAQTMDVLSSMSSIAGYRAALIGATELDRYMPMMMTAAGTIPPAKVLVLGAGVAGLQAIATSKRLGAVVEAFDVRPAVKEQVESLGARFVDIPLEEEAETEGGYAKEQSADQQERQRQVIHDHAANSDIVITTALIPGKKAPLLITAETVRAMKPGSVVVDLAAEQGGNCEETAAGETRVVEGVRVAGPLNLPSQLAHHASQLYAKNMLSLLNHLLKEGEPHLDFEDEITLNTTITHNGETVSPLLKNS